VNGKCAALAVCFVGGCVMQCLTVVKHDAACGEVDDVGLGGVNLVAKIEQGICSFRFFVIVGLKV